MKILSFFKEAKCTKEETADRKERCEATGGHVAL